MAVDDSNRSGALPPYQDIADKPITLAEKFTLWAKIALESNDFAARKDAIACLAAYGIKVVHGGYDAAVYH